MFFDASIIDRIRLRPEVWSGEMEKYPTWLCSKKLRKNGRFKDGLPINNGDFPLDDFPFADSDLPICSVYFKGINHHL